ncbi:hypothetical protein TNCT_685201 [Trichonephila clavata]|uniref:Uncharacterized protein n=1 Tax=Trichonephila clavata TaxID=2740835 RepID=A0A8X6FVK7_TRICU|nr:hypothetical protein TNCT_685201 [Trichonephila clavata]
MSLRSHATPSVARIPPPMRYVRVSFHVPFELIRLHIDRTHRIEPSHHTYTTRDHMELHRNCLPAILPTKNGTRKQCFLSLFRGKDFRNWISDPRTAWNKNSIQVNGMGKGEERSLLFSCSTRTI